MEESMGRMMDDLRIVSERESHKAYQDSYFGSDDSTMLKIVAEIEHFQSVLAFIGRMEDPEETGYYGNINSIEKMGKHIRNTVSFYDSLTANRFHESKEDKPLFQDDSLVRVFMKMDFDTSTYKKLLFKIRFDLLNAHIHIPSLIDKDGGGCFFSPEVAVFGTISYCINVGDTFKAWTAVIKRVNELSYTAKITGYRRKGQTEFIPLDISLPRGWDNHSNIHLRMREKGEFEYRLHMEYFDETMHEEKGDIIFPVTVN